MRSRPLVLTAVLAALAMGLLFAGPASAKRVLFVQTNQTSGNQIAVYDRAQNGTLSYVAMYATGGLGGAAAGSASDPLASQGSLMTAKGGTMLLAVNAGSDTVTVFRVRGDHLYKRQVIASGGDFPASIAVHGNLVYVLNSGGVGMVTGYRLRGQRLHKLDVSRSLGLTNVVPPNFLTSPGQVGFTPNGRRLIVTTKASTSSIVVFMVKRGGRLSSTPVVNASTTPVPFGFTFDPHGKLVVTEAANSNVTTYKVNRDNTLTGIGDVSDGQTALCWITRARGFYYGSNTGTDNVSSFKVSKSGVPTLVEAQAATTEAGPTDSATTRTHRNLYVQCGSAGTVDAFRVNADGTLTLIDTVTGLPMGIEGIATVN